MSNGALKMPAMAETVPDSVRSRCDLRAEGVEVVSIAMPPLTSDRLLR